MAAVHQDSTGGKKDEGGSGDSGEPRPYATPLCAYWGSQSEMLELRDHSQADIIDRMNAIPPDGRIGLCDGKSTFGTINVACLMGWKDVLAFLIDTIPVAAQISFVKSLCADDSPLSVSLVTNQPDCLEILMCKYAHVYTTVIGSMFYFLTTENLFRHWRNSREEAYERHGVVLITSHPESIMEMIISLGAYIGEEAVLDELITLVCHAMCLYRSHNTEYAEETELNLTCIEEGLLVLIEACVKQNPVCLYARSKRTGMSLFVKMCQRLPTSLLALLAPVCVTEETRHSLLGFNENALHRLAVKTLDGINYAEQVRFLASLLPEWLRERNDAGLLPRELEKLMKPETVTVLQDMTGSVTKGAM